MNMRTFSLSILMVMLLSGITSAQSESIKVGSTTRTFIVYTPSGLPEKPALVVCMHGLGGNGSQQRSYSGFDKVADKGKFVVVYPDGIDKSIGSSPGWDITNNTDVDFISDLIDTMAGRHNIDLKRVYASGFSMGGMMSYVLACRISDRIAAIGTASGYPLYANDNCSPSRPVPICHTHGTTDETVPYTGLEKWIDKFVKSNGCTGSPTTTNPTSKYKREYWGQCDQESEIVIYHFDGMGHGYVNTSQYTFSASDTFWTFFEKHTLGNTVGTGAPVAGTRLTGTCSAVYSGGTVDLKSTSGICNVRITDIAGREKLLLKTPTGQKRHIILPVGRLARGIYIVNVTGSTDGRTTKILVP